MFERFDEISTILRKHNVTDGRTDNVKTDMLRIKFSDYVFFLICLLSHLVPRDWL